MNLASIQSAIKEYGLDGWLFCDFKGKDQIAARILGLTDSQLATRRWFYYIPAEGEPQKLNSSVEPFKLDSLPGTKTIFSTWQQMQEGLKAMLSGAKKVAMQYSPMNMIPYIAVVDAGTVELVRSFGVEPVSSGDLVSQFEAYLTEEDIDSHKKCGDIMTGIYNETIKLIRDRINAGNNPTEYEVMLYMRKRYDESGLFWDHGPIVGVNEHAGDPHFEPDADNTHVIREGDLLLIDHFCRLNREGSVWYDVTWMSFVGNNVPEKVQKIWEINRDARNAGFALVKERFAAGQPVYGYEVDDATRKVIDDAGYGKYFVHRTGHNISTSLHGNGAHMDNFETKDLRTIIKGSIFSIEPGIYMPHEGLGFRTEIDCIVHGDGRVEAYGPVQGELVII